MPEADQTDFQREERYIVIKRKNLTSAQEDSLREHLKASGIPTVECVVVESDWSIYDNVWDQVESEWRSRHG